MSNIAVKLENIGKCYRIHSIHKSLLYKIMGREEKNFWALKNVNIEIYKGEKIGIVGVNGAGKTTLLRVIAGITKSSTGKVLINGKIVALIDLEAGFQYELTGRENIVVNGLIIGMSKKEIKEKMNFIIHYADIGQFIDSPFYTYSNGMKFRLAFAIAIASECDILLIDEVFLVGDANFQQKIIETVQEIQKKEKNITTIICSHSPTLIWGFAEKFFKCNSGTVTYIPKSKMRTNMQRYDKNFRNLLKLDPT